MKYIRTALTLLVICLSIQSCATTTPNSNPNVNNQIYTTPTLQKQSYMYRSPPPAALQARGLAR